MRLFTVAGLLFLFIATAIILPPGASEAAPPQQAAQDICLARWEWFTEPEPEGISYWRAPFVENATGSLDLRSNRQAGQPGPLALGWGLFAYDKPMGSTGMHCLGGDLDARLSAIQADTIALVLGKLAGDIQARSLRSLVKELFTEEADPTGETFWKPLRISRKNGFVVRLGGYDKPIIQEPFSTSHPAFQATLDVRWADYRRLRALVQDKLNSVDLRVREEGQKELEALRRWTGHDMLALYGRTGSDLVDKLVPPEYLADGREQPRTTITDSFNRADQAGLGTSSEGWSWSEVTNQNDIVSNQAQATVGNALNLSRADQDLSSDDHRAEFDIIAIGSNSASFIGPVARFSSSEATGYIARRFGTNSNSFALAKIVAGTITALGTPETTATTHPVIECNNSDISRYDGVTLKETITDTSITGNLRTGIIQRTGAVPSGYQVDDFEAADLAAPATRRIVVIE